MPIFYMTIGLPGSGKSTYVEKMNDVVVHSSDNIRQELFGDINDQTHNEEVFKTLFKRVLKDLNNGNNVVFDATNINYKRRIEFLKSIKKVKCKKVALLFATPVIDCIKNNNQRDRKVPDDVIMRMYHNFYIPYYYEGWDNIQIIYFNPIDSLESMWNLLYGINGLYFINQHNSHHSLSIGQHCIKTRELLNNMVEYENPDLLDAALIHDIGKVKTMTLLNAKDEFDGNAHYYQHHLIGAYDSLFVDEYCDVLYRAILIQWHMQPYNFEKQKTIDKYKKLWGEKLFNDIMLLHKADEMAH